MAVIWTMDHITALMVDLCCVQIKDNLSQGEKDQPDQ